MIAIDVKLAGVYCITCNVNGRKYYGQSQAVLQRVTSHISSLNCGRHINTRLQQDWVRFGADQFAFAMVERVDCASKRRQLESELIAAEATSGQLYNATISCIERVRPKPPQAKPSSPIASGYRFSPVKSIPSEDYPKLLTISESAKELGMTINTFKYQIRKFDSPLALAVGETPTPFWYAAEIRAWKPTKRKTKPA